MNYIAKILITVFLISLISITILAQVQEANLLGGWNDGSLISASFGRYNEIWGHALNEREYAIIGTTFGTHFIDITNPTNPQEAVRVQGADFGANLIHRDFHNYGDYLYSVADEGASTLQIMDMSLLPDTVTVVYDSDEFFFNAHNIFIDTARARLYVLNASTNSGFWPVQLYNISNPTEPLLLGSYRTFEGIQLGQVHDAFIKNDTAFLNAGNTGLLIVNFADPDNPELLSSLLDYPDQGYNHSGWASEDMQHYFLADETFRTRIKNIDISDIREPEIVGFTNVRDTISDELPHNPIWHCDHLFVASYYDMLQVYDVSDPTSPERVLFFDSDNGPNNGQFRSAWGVYPFLPSGNILLSSLGEGLFVFEGLGLENCGAPTVSASDDKLQNEHVDIYPNPSAGVFTFEREFQDPLDVALYDATGKKVLSIKNYDEPTLDITQLPDGIYSVLFTPSDNTNQRRFARLIKLSAK